MECSPKNLAARRYTLRLSAALAFYIVFLVVALRAFSDYHPVGIGAYILAVLPALAVVGMLVAAALYLKEETDEFLRTILAQSMLWSVGAMLTASTIWGFIELFGLAPHFPLYLLFPVFWFGVAIAPGILRARYR